MTYQDYRTLILCFQSLASFADATHAFCRKNPYYDLIRDVERKCTQEFKDDKYFIEE